MQLDGLGLDQQEAMQERGGRRIQCVLSPCSPDPARLRGWDLWTPLLGPDQNFITHPLPSTTFCTVGLGWVAGGAEEELSR